MYTTSSSKAPWAFILLCGCAHRAPSPCSCAAPPVCPSTGGSNAAGMASHDATLATQAAAGASPSASASSSAAKVSSTPGALKPRDCPPDVSAEVASILFQEADHLIKTGDEHPTREETGLYLSLLQISAQSGNVEAQRRFGNYVVGYWVTDFMFWPKERKAAITALAMLYEAARADPERAHPWERQLPSGSAILSADSNLRLPSEWVSAALVEAKKWERCHPDFAKGANAGR